MLVIGNPIFFCVLFFFYDEIKLIWMSVCDDTLDRQLLRFNSRDIVLCSLSRGKCYIVKGFILFSFKFDIMSLNKT